MRTRSSSRLVQMLDQFDKACTQMSLLQQEISNIQVRCERAEKSNKISFMYQQQIKRLTWKAMLRVYVHYVQQKAVVIMMTARLHLTGSLDWIEEHIQSSISRTGT